MFCVVVKGKTSSIIGLGESELQAIRMLDRTPLAFASRKATNLSELHNYFLKHNFRWYVQCKLMTPTYTTVKQGCCTITQT